MRPREEITRLAIKHQLSFSHNPEGGAYLAPNGDRCQVHSQQSFVEDLAQLRTWLVETGRETQDAKEGGDASL